MKNNSLALYLLADGTHANPKDCEPDADGVLRHIYGMAVSLNEDGTPMTIGQGAVDNKNTLAVELGEQAAASAAEQATVEEVAAEPEPAPADPAPEQPQPEAEAQEQAEEATVEPAPQAEEAPPTAAPEAPAVAHKPKQARPVHSKRYKNREIKGR